jgi:acetyl esterase
MRPDVTVLLDPATATLLGAIAAQGGKPLHEQTPDEVRALVSASSGMLAGPKTDVGAVSDRTIPGPAGDIPIRVYTPNGPRGGLLPAIVYFHGGGFVAGDLETHDGTARYLCRHVNAIVIAVDYRRPPEQKFPAAVDDAFAAVEWAAEHGARLGGDPKRLAVAGDSAGGNLAAAVCLMARDRGGPRIGAQILIYPVTAPAAGSTSASYREHADGCLLTRDMLLCYWQHYAPGAATDPHPYAAPLHAGDLNGLPPALVLTAEYDPLRDEGEEYAGRLRAADGVTEAVRYDGFIHNFFWASEALDAFGFAVRDIARTLDRHLPGG